MGVASGKTKDRIDQLRALRDSQLPGSARGLLEWVLDVLNGRAELPLTGNPSIDDMPEGVLRVRTKFAEQRIGDLLHVLDVHHTAYDCYCPDGRCVLSGHWVPESVRRLPNGEKP